MPDVDVGKWESTRAGVSGDRADTGTWSVALLTAAVAMAILIFRKPDAIIHPQLWAEDGVIYLNGALRSGFSAIVVPYAGYGQLIPRLIAAILVPIVPLEQIPLAFNVAGLLVAGVVVFLLCVSRNSVPYKPLFALVPVLIPHDGEVFFAIDNILTFSGIVLISVALERPAENFKETLIDATIIFFFGLTGPYIILVAPIFIVKWFLIRPNKFNISLVILVLLETILTIYLSRIDRSHDIGDVFHHVENLAGWTYIITVSLYNWIGGEFSRFYFYNMAPYVGIAFLVFCAISVYGVWRNSVVQLFSLLGLALYGAVAYFSMLIRIPFHDFLYIHPFGNAPRYTVIPYIVVIWILLYFLFTFGNWRRIIALVFLFAAAVNTFPQFEAKAYPDLNWKKQVATVGHNWTDVEILPPGWKAAVCRYPCNSK